MPCTPNGCLYTRPADRSDDFFNVAPKLSISYDITSGAVAYVSLSRGFRPPEITELYRLQRGQQVADLGAHPLLGDVGPEPVEGHVRDGAAGGVIGTAVRRVVGEGRRQPTR